MLMTKREVLDGREYLVTPTIAIIEGVLNGEFVSGDEINKSAHFWNDVPVTVYHPGDETSARDVDILKQFGVGRFYGVEVRGNKLFGEIWIDLDKVNKLSQKARDVVERIENDDPVDVSTAYYCDVYTRSGEYNGIPYRGVQYNLRPDHLALLPDAVGACSWADGCGTPRENTLRQFRTQVLVSNPYPSEYSCRIEDPAVFEDGSFRRITQEMEDGRDIIVIVARKKGKDVTSLQGFRYPADLWTEAEAKTHCKDNDGEFHQAVEQNKFGGVEMFTRKQKDGNTGVVDTLIEAGIPVEKEALSKLDEGVLQWMANQVKHEVVETEETKQEVSPWENIFKDNGFTPEDLVDWAASMKVQKQQLADDKLALIDGLVSGKRCNISKETLEGMALEALKELTREYTQNSYLGVGVPGVKGDPEAIPAPPHVLLETKKE